MARTTMIFACLALCLVTATAGPADAFTSIGTNWRTQYPAACQTLQDATTSAVNCVLCHTAGFGFNVYGRDLKDNNVNFTTIANWDSDGDGRTNLQEILEDCTFPGDGTSVPVEASSWDAVRALFR